MYLTLLKDTVGILLTISRQYKQGNRRKKKKKIKIKDVFINALLLFVKANIGMSNLNFPRQEVQFNSLPGLRPEVLLVISAMLPKLLLIPYLLRNSQKRFLV